MQHGTYLLVLPWELDAVGGVSQVAGELYRHFDQSGGFTPRILIPDWSALAPVDSVGAAGTRTTRLRLRPPFDKGWPLFQLMRYVGAFLPERRRIRALVRRHDVRVVNCHYVGSHALAWSFAKAAGVYRGKVVLSLHGLDIRTIAAMRGARRRVWRFVLESADAVVACSQGLADETIASMELSGRNVVTIHNGVHADRLEALAKAANALPRPPSRGPRIVNLGTFEHKKGHDILLRAFASIAGRFPTAHLTIMGRSAETLESTRALLAELELGDRVTLTLDAPHDAALALLRDADLFVLPSRNEAFSIALLEAGAMGKPVVAASVCGVPELVEQRVSGVLVPPENVDALAAGIVELLEDGEAAARYGSALQRRVLRDFTADVTFRKYLALVSGA